MGVFERLEAWLLALQRDRERSARYFRIAWWVSNLVIVLGVVCIFLIYSGRWRP